MDNSKLLELCSELAHTWVVENKPNGVDIFELESDNKNCQIYTEICQDMFNSRFDYYYEMITNKLCDEEDNSR